MRMLTFLFQLGLKFHFDHMDILRIFQPVCRRAENPSPVSETRLGFSARAVIDEFTHLDCIMGNQGNKAGNSKVSMEVQRKIYCT